MSHPHSRTTLIETAASIAQRFGPRVPAPVELQAAYGMSESTARRWTKALHRGCPAITRDPPELAHVIADRLLQHADILQLSDTQLADDITATHNCQRVTAYRAVTIAREQCHG